MKERFYRILNIKDSEADHVFDLLGVQFFIGLANALVNIIAFTLFIYNFQIRYLPDVYLVVAGGLILLNFIYEKLEHRFSPFSLLKYVIAFSAVLLFILWLGLSYGNRDYFIFALIVCSVLIYMLCGYAFWGQVSLLFNVRESRRVFSIVGGGDIPAKLIGYIAGPLLIPVLGLNNVIWFAILALVMGIILMQRILRKKSWQHLKKHAHRHEPEETGKRQSFIAYFFRNKLILAISLLSMLSYNVFVLVDFTFISQVKLKFDNITDLAFYIALFFAFGRLVAMAFKLIFTSRVIERLGVVSSLFITPLALFVFCMAFIMYGGHPDYNVFIFGLMAMLTEVLRSTIQEPVFFILFQPLKENLRLKGHIISKGYMYPPSLIIVGLSLLFIYETEIEVSILFAIKILLLNLCIWVAVIFLVRKTYLNTIQESIKKGTFNSDDIYLGNQHMIDILLAKIESGKKMEVIYALNILEKSGYQHIQPLLQQQLLSGVNADVQKYALDRIENIAHPDPVVLRQMLAADPDAELKAKIFSLLCKYDQSFLKECVQQMDEHGEHIKKIIIIHLLNEREFSFLLTAGNEINRLINSSQPTDRELAIEIISELKHVQFSEAIEKLLNDNELSVKRVAVIAACKLKQKRSVPAIMQLLNVPEEKNIAIKGLLLYGDQLFSDLLEESDALAQHHGAELIKIASRQKGKFSTAFLIEKLKDHRDTGQEVKIVEALWIKGYEPVGAEERRMFELLLNKQLKNGINKFNDYSHVPVSDHKELVKRSIYSEVKNDLTASLKLCSLLYGGNDINRVLELMGIDQQHKLFNAMEMIDMVLPKRLSTDVNQLFDFILDPEHTPPGNARSSGSNLFHKVIFDQPQDYNSWTRAICIFSSWKSNEKAILEKIGVCTIPVEDRLLRETHNYVTAQIKTG